jgi:5'-3' exonuclease
MIEKDKEDIEKRIRIQNNIQHNNTQNDDALITKKEIKQHLEKMFKELMIPYICSPNEGEAQCCGLQQSEHVEYIASNDSDVFLFGCDNVIKNFLIEDRVTVLHMQDMQQRGFTQQRIIDYAMFLKSDYCDGVYGVGPKTATQTLNTFTTLDNMLQTIKPNEFPSKRIQTKIEKLDLHEFNNELQEMHIKTQQFLQPKIENSNGIICHSQHNVLFAKNQLEFDD